MTRWVFATLGGSDIQYASDIGKKPEEKRFKDYYEECRTLYYYLVETGDMQDLIAPLLQALVQELCAKGHPPDRMYLFYTDQQRQPADDEAPGKAKDTYWAFRIIQYLAQSTDFFGIRFQVEGIHVRGNPANYEEMVFLYKEIMTDDYLKKLGICDHDELYACFTAGTPAMSQYLLLGFSSLQMPRQRMCLAVEMKQNRSLVHHMPVPDLLRYEGAFGLLKEMLRSRQFPQASQLLESAKFSFLAHCEREVLHWIDVMHHRFLFCFDDALRSLGHCRTAFVREPFFARMNQELTMLDEGMKSYQDLSVDSVQDPNMKVLMAEYLHKVLFFWDSKQWNEFAIIGCTFYEWILQLAFYEAIGLKIARKNSGKKYWRQFLLQELSDPDFPVWLRNLMHQWGSQDQLDQKIPEGRFLYLDILKQSPDWSSFASSEWCVKMGKFYTEVRNSSVHQLRGTGEQTVIDILGEDWPKQTKKILAAYFHLEAAQSKFDHSINLFLEFLNQQFMKQFVSRKHA